MALWEYKVITSGLHGFASPTLLESHLNTLGKDEWEIIHFQTQANNPLAFNGLARRSTTRDWTPPEPIVVAPSRPLAAEPTAAAPKASSKPESEVASEAPKEGDKKETPPLREETLRPIRNTEHDLDHEAEETDDDDWNEWENVDDDLPTFFDAIKPHLRRNQKGPGMSVALDYLAKRWELREADISGALKECGFTLPETEEADPEYFEYEGDLYWVNRNNRGQLFLNTREKPRPVFRVAPVQKLSPDDPALAELTAERAAEKAEIEKRKAERAERAERQAAQAAAHAVVQTPESVENLPAEPDAPSEPAKVSSSPITGLDLLDRIRPLMRRNRRGPGYSGSVGYLARALKQSDAEIVAAFAALGLNIPAGANDKPVYVEIGNGVYWVNKDNRGGVWINGREKKEGAPRPNAEENAPESSTEGSGNGNGDATTPSAEPTQAVPALPAETQTAAPALAETPASISEATPTEASPLAPATTPETAGNDLILAPTESGEGAADEDSGGASEETAPPITPPSVENETLAAMRPFLKAGKKGSGVSAEINVLATSLGKTEEEIVARLVGAGLVIPASADDKPVLIPHAGEVFWLNQAGSEGPLSLSAKTARLPRRSGAGRSRAPKKPKPDEPKSES